MHSKYIGPGCPDNPSRTADHGYFSWERESEPENECHEVSVILEALTTKQGAYGLCHADLLHMLADYVFNMDDTSIIHCLSAARDTNAVEQACGFIANRGKS